MDEVVRLIEEALEAARAGHVILTEEALDLAICACRRVTRPDRGCVPGMGLRLRSTIPETYDNYPPGGWPVGGPL